MRQKLFIGPQVRRLRQERGWLLEPCAARLGISPSYLSQIEANKRPVTSCVLMGLVDLFEVPAESLEADEAQRLVTDLRAVVAEADAPHAPVPLSELRMAALHAPALARRVLDLHRTNLRLAERLRLTEETLSLDEPGVSGSLLPYEEVRDYFHDRDNYVDQLDRLAEGLAAEIAGEAVAPDEAGLIRHLEERHGVRVRVEPASDWLRRFDESAALLTLDGRYPAATRKFQIAFHLVAQAFAEAIEAELAAARFRTAAAKDICRVGLCNYAASALVMPYGSFAREARRIRHDTERLAWTFGASLEQVCHRLSTLQRPGERGSPIYFVRLDLAGNITKRHSATRLRFARFGGACPLWNVHEAVATPDRFLAHVVEMPDGARYLSVARCISKASRSYFEPPRKYVLGFGCEIDHAHEFVYASGLDLNAPPTPIGVSCRICERNDCAQRAFPPVDRPLRVPQGRRGELPYTLA